MRILIRKAERDEWKSLANMNKELIQTEGSSNPMSLSQLEDRMKGWLDGEWEIVMIVLHLSVIGYVVYQIRSDDYSAEKTVYIRQFYIEDRYRGCGYGTAAMDDLIEHIFPANAAVSLDVLESNHQGYQFWTKYGFKPYFTHMKLSDERDSRSC